MFGGRGGGRGGLVSKSAAAKAAQGADLRSLLGPKKKALSTGTTVVVANLHQAVTLADMKVHKLHGVLFSQ